MPLSSAHFFPDAAVEIGRSLVALARWSGDRCTWVVRADGGEVPAGGDLYRGSAGIGLFLAELHAHAPDRGVLACARGALRHALAEGDGALRARSGLFAGAPGVACACARAGRALGEEEWVAAAGALLATLPVPVSTRHFDVVQGAAGAIVALLNVAAGTGDPALTERAARLGEWLVETAVTGPWGWSWSDPAGTAEWNLLGMAHGASGAAVALMELHAAGCGGVFRHAAEQALVYERRFFSPAASNWPDLRVSMGRDPAFTAAWCSGAAGSGLARLRACELLGHDAWGGEARAAIEGARRAHRGHAPSWSLCHGDAGLCDLLLEASRVLSLPELRHRAEAIAGEGWERHGATGDWPSGAQDRAADPSLMLGMAGVGHAFLRLATDAAGSVLLPRPRGGDAAAPEPRRDDVRRVRERAVDRWFGQTRGALIAAGRDARLPDRAGGAACDVHAAWLRLGARVSAIDPAEPVDLPAATAFAFESARYETSVAGLPPAPAPAPSASAEDPWYRLARGVRHVRAGGGDGGESAGDASFLVVPAVPMARSIRLNLLAELVAGALEAPGTAAMVNARVAQRLETSVPAEALAARIDAQLAQLAAAGATAAAAAPMDAAGDALHAVVTGARVPTRREQAWARLARLAEDPHPPMPADPLYESVRVEAAFAEVEELVRTVYLGEVFEPLLDRFRAAATHQERRAAWAALASALARVAGRPETLVLAL